MMKFQLFTDGGSRGNPGDSAYAYIIRDHEGREIASGSNYLGTMTNNEAEYHGLLAGLKEVLSRGGTEVEVFMDSELVIKQLKGQYRVKAAHLAPLNREAVDILMRMKTAKVHHVPRENEVITKADAMVNWTLDQHNLARQLRR
jgi:ribonuclease HI